MWYLTRILAQLRIIAEHSATIGRILWSYVRTHQRVSLITGGMVIVIIGGIIYITSGDDSLENKQLSEVTLVRVSDLGGSSPLSLIGDVRSTNEALVSPESSGSVQAVYRSLGDYVQAGAIIAELKNDSQRAAVSQARAALEKTKSGVNVGSIGVENAKSSLASAQDSARVVIDSAYASIDTAIRKYADEVFSNPQSAQPKFTVSTSNSQLVLTAESARLSVQPILKRHTTEPQTGTVDELLTELTILSQEASAVRDLLSSVVLALNNAIPTGSNTDAVIAGYRADTTASLASVNALRTSLASTIELLKSKRSAVSIAEQALSQGDTGISADITGAEANVQAALANLERTIIRAPISGTINRLDIDVGSFVNASVPVVYITNTRGIEAVVFVSEKDIRDVAVGAKAIVGGVAEGKVIRVAQALDPLTKKAEIRIALPSNAPLVSGQSASVEIERAIKVVTTTSTFSIPLSALKITPEGPVVFTVDGSILKAQPVATGSLEGSKIVITSGLTGDMMIVEDARGLKDGQSITVRGQ